MSSSPSVRSEGETEPDLMSIRLFHAAIKGTMRWPPVAGEHEVPMVLGGHYPTQAELQHVTPSRDTLLHLLVTNKNPLAWSVFESHTSLLRAQNMMLETPLHSAAKVGNNDFISRLIERSSDTVKEVLRKRNKEEDTALHVAAKHGHTDVVLKLMRLDPEVENKVSNEMLSLLNIAIIKGNLEMVQRMLGVNSALASTPFSDGMFPVHVAARMGQTEMVKYFIDFHIHAAELLDPRGRNLFHIAAEEGRNDIFRGILKAPCVTEVLTMKDATDYEGNSMLHVAAMKGNLSLMKDIWEKYNGQGGEQNTHGLTPTQNTHGLTPILSLMKDIWEKYNGLTPIKKNTHGLTPIDLFLRQLRATTKVDDSLARTIDQKRLSHKWFNNAMQLSLENQWDKAQVIGLGSVLIITVTFAAAFTIPGGYNQNNGTPLLWRSYMFRAFTIANTFAFTYGFLSLYILLKRAAEGRPGLAHLFAIDTFLLAASSMFVAFGLGLCATLASVSKPMAIIILCITFLISFVNNINVRSDNWIIGLAFYFGTFLAIFGLAKV